MTVVDTTTAANGTENAAAPGGAAQSAQTGTNLTKAVLSIHEPPVAFALVVGDKMQDVEFQFNPDQVVITGSADWAAPGASKFSFARLPQFQGAQPMSMSLTAFLDSTTVPTDTTVMDQVHWLLKCCEVTMLSMLSLRPSTPWVFFQWGGFDTASFVGYVQSVTATYTLFNTSGVPIRAKADLTICEIPLAILGQNPTSGALEANRVHRVSGGDTLQSMAWREYGDATKWRTIAEANGIDDPMRLTVGQQLLIPATADRRS
jgi:nucleoid-associated protein YgaU